MKVPGRAAAAAVAPTEQARGWTSVADAWLGEHLGRPAWRVLSQAGGRGAAEVLAALAPGACFAFAKVPAMDTAALVELQSAGFRLIDTNVTFGRAARRALAPASGVEVRFAAPTDAAGVADLAERGFSFSRFHLDPHIPPPVANRVKRAWVESFFAGRRGDAMVVALRHDVVVGFLQLLRPSPAELVIDLVAVDAAERGAGTAAAMIGLAEADPLVERLVVGTQVANVPSIRFYEKSGFRLLRSEYVLHYHGDAR